MRPAGPLLLSTLCAAAIACGGKGETSASAGASTGTTDADATGPITGGPDELQRCAPTCKADADCLVDGVDIGFTCIDGVCDVPDCAGDDACVALLSGWSEPCTAQAGCAMDEACVDAGAGEGRCAVVPTMALACADLGLVETMRPRLEGDALVLVCAAPDAKCVEGACRSPCASDDACPALLGTPHCEVATGACVCSSDADCLAAMQPGFVACVDGRCGCTVDADCVGGSNVDVCYAGACGCSGPAACTDPVFDGADLICRP